MRDWDIRKEIDFSGSSSIQTPRKKFWMQPENFDAQLARETAESMQQKELHHHVKSM
jgi:hypothetical protein